MEAVAQLEHNKISRFTLKPKKLNKSLSLYGLSKTWTWKYIRVTWNSAVKMFVFGFGLNLDSSKLEKKDLRVLPKFFTFVSAKKWNKNLPEF